ncbi:MAG: D-2-hydroxyacid dehydrogenase family protein, partial [Burkholderiaceae bacterium]
MLKVAVVNDFLQVFRQAADWSRLDAIAHVDFFHEHLDTEDKAITCLAPYDVVVTERERTHFTARVLENLPRLRLLVATGSHNRFIDFSAATRRGITVSGTDSHRHAAPELAFGLILALMRRIVTDDRVLRDGGWQSGLGRSLRGKTLGVVGLGVTGQCMLKFADAFGMQTIAWSPHLDNERARAAGSRRVELPALMSDADVVSLHLVLSETTRGIIGRRELALMKPSACLINTSRGALVDEVALLELLSTRRIAGAALDTFDIEPLPVDHTL